MGDEVKKYLGTEEYFGETMDRGDLPQFHDGEIFDPSKPAVIETADGKVIDYRPRPPAAQPPQNPVAPPSPAAPDPAAPPAPATPPAA